MILCPNRWQVVQRLIAVKCNVKVKSKHNIMTPLVWAARKGFREVVSMLVDAKADMEMRSDESSGNYLPACSQSRLHFVVVARRER